jgi:acyl-CoA synthetase (AMP-forming)/AMP-acid ligase II
MNLTMLLDMAAEGFGDRVVVGRRADGFTAARLRELALGGAAAVRAAGADAVLYLAVNGPAFPVALFAAAHAGVPLVPVNYRLGQEQLDHLLSNHPKALGIAGPGESDALLRASIQTLTVDEWLKAAADAAEGAEAEDEGDPDTTAVTIYTSGTTSSPKGVLLRHHNLVSYVLSSVEFAGAEDDEAALVSVPPYHIAAVANVITNLYAGRRTIVLQQFSPSQWLNLARAEGVTNALVVPTMLSRIMDASDVDLTVPQLRTLAYGGAPMPQSVIERALRVWSHVDFVNAYGLTETSSTIAVLGPDDHRAALGAGSTAARNRLSSVGKVIPAIDLEVRDERGLPVGPGVVGRIWVRGEQVSAEYAGIGKVLDEQGFFDTRDQGWIDEESYLFIGGRADDTIIRGAENIAPAEIEEVILAHADVSDAVVVGVPDEEWGQRIEAAVVLRDGANADEDGLRQFVRDRLRGSKTPDRILFWAELPRTETGKLLRRNVLAQMSSPESVPKADRS